MAMSNSNYKNSWLDDYSTATAVGASPGHFSAVTASNVMSSRISGDALMRMNIDEMNHLMKGEMVSSALVYGEMQRNDMISSHTESGFKTYVKQQLCEMMVRDMMKNNLIEYTMSHDPQYMQYAYRARAYVMPDHMTKILREFVQRNT